MADEPDIPYIVCIRADFPTRSAFTDTNVKGICSRCHAAVQHRPNIMRPSQLVCTICLPALVAEHEANGDTPNFGITTTTLHEILALSRRN